MSAEENLENYINICDTGDYSTKYKILSIPFDKYIIKIKVNEFNKFISIEEIDVNKNFIEKRNNSKQFYDLEKYYED